MKQSWKSCKHHLGNLDSLMADRPLTKLARKIIPPTEAGERLEREGIHQWYYCVQPSITALNVYVEDLFDGKPIAQLYNVYDHNLDIMTLEQVKATVVKGLRMCTHCGFYELKSDKPLQ
jgi:hypothetical protein